MALDKYGGSTDKSVEHANRLYTQARLRYYIVNETGGDVFINVKVGDRRASPKDVKLEVGQACGDESFTVSKDDVVKIETTGMIDYSVWFVQE